MKNFSLHGSLLIDAYIQYRMAGVWEKLAPWRLRLSEPNFEIVRQACIRTQAADLLLPCEINAIAIPFLNDDVRVLATAMVDTTKIKKCQTGNKI